MSNTVILRLPALEIVQGANRVLYSFAVDGKQLMTFATVSRIHRQSDEQLGGYQRPEVLSHIAEIRRYLESSDPMIPNAIVVAFDERVRFEPAEQSTLSLYSRPGTIFIPIDAGLSDQEKPGWIVDGQQRMAAIREASIQSFPICVTAFIAKDDQEQKEQFILVNSTKPLPKGLIYELLPTTQMTLPSLLQRRRFPAQLSSRLNYDPESPFKGKIRTPTNAAGVVQDNSVLKMIENSLSDGALYRFRDPDTGSGDIDSMLNVLKAFWHATAKTFKEAWELPPTRSRLVHGAGIVSMGFLMDAIADRYHEVEHITEEHFLNDLQSFQRLCRWTQGYWDFGPGAQRKWNEIQNTSKDIKLLANYLLLQYRAMMTTRPREEFKGRSASLQKTLGRI
jgi:DGQHR domain-containing protein